MKKFLFILTLFFVLLSVPAQADTMPFYMDNIPRESIGVYQTDNEITLYSKPDDMSDKIKNIKFSYQSDTMPDGVFAVLLNSRKLGFLYVTDIYDDGWVEVIYDKRTNAKGWTKTTDSMQFLPWINFYNMYGRKYGLRLLKDSPKDLQILKAKSDDMSQTISKLNYVKQIKLTKIQGNWALVSVQDLDEIPKTGFLKWRNSDGKIYAFPNIK